MQENVFRDFPVVQCLLCLTLVLVLGVPLLAVEPWKFVVTGDVMNNDVALDDEDWWGSDLDGVWESDPEHGGATTYAALPFFLDAIAAENPDFVLVPGDLMQGRWSLDPFNDAEIVAAANSGDPAFAHLAGLTGVEARKAHVDFMAARYYPDWHQWWAERGLMVYHIPGDHEYGDNDWNASYDPELIAHYAARYAQYAVNNPGNGPAGFQKRAWSLAHKNLTVYGVDQFETDAEGEMATGVTGHQLAWLENAMAGQTTPFGIVIGHMPVLPGYSFSSSSRLEVPGGSDSAFWQAMVSAGIDAYMPGEVHAFSLQVDDGLAQIITGAQPSSTTRFHYVVCTVYEDRIEMQSKILNTTHGGVKGKQYDPYGTDDYVRRSVKLTQAQFNTGVITDGSMTLDKSTGHTQYINRTGAFAGRYTLLNQTFIDGASDPDLPIASLTVKDSVSAIDYAYAPQALSEDVPATVDTDNQWNSVGGGGIPEFLQNADLVRVNQADSRNSDLDMEIVLKSSADVFVLFSDNIGNRPTWLTGQFSDTAEKMGLDKGGDHSGPDGGIDETYSVWKKRVIGAQTIHLAQNHSGFGASMYGVAIVPVADADGDKLGDRWESESYGDPLLYGPEDDPNQDARSLLLDYAMDRDGLRADPDSGRDITVRVTRDGDGKPTHLVIEHRRSRRAPNITWKSWRSPDLRTWTPFSWDSPGYNHSTLTADPDGDGSAEVLLLQAVITETDDENLYIRFEPIAEEL